MANAHSIGLLAVAGALVAGCGGSGGDFSQLNTLLQSLSSSIAHTGNAPAEILRRGRELAGRAAALAGSLGLEACTAPQ
jgi:hypothetical protein